MTTPLGEAVRRLRTERGMTPYELSMAAGLGKNFVADLEGATDRNPRLDVIKKLAKALGVRPAYLIDGTTSNETIVGPPISDASPWTPPENAQRMDLSDVIRKIGSALAPSARHAVTFRLGRSLSGFNLEEGDVLVVDLNRPAATGDLTLATVVDMATGAGTTVLRRFLSPYLVPADSTKSEDILLADGTRTVIMGPVVAMYRAPELS